MANNRLYIANTKDETYLTIAKLFSDGWQLGNVKVLQKFLSEIYEYDKTDLVIGTECDDDFYDKIKEYTSYNPGGWVYEGKED